MTRISLKEAYDNRDVIAMLVNLRDDVDELLNILKDIDPNGDLTNVVTKTGDQTIDGRKTFIGEIVADCDIIQNGAAYETHAEQIYSHNDYLIMRDGQLNGLSAGSYSGLQVKKYNGSDDVRMVVDNTGIMRVGDINDEKPLTVRDEAADMTSGALVKWDGVNQKIITSSANIGDDTQPVKIVGGEPVAVTTPLLQGSYSSGSGTRDAVNTESGTFSYEKWGRMVVVHYSFKPVSSGNDIVVASGLPAAVSNTFGVSTNPSGISNGLITANTSGQIMVNTASTETKYGCVVYISAS